MAKMKQAYVTWAKKKRGHGPSVVQDDDDSYEFVAS